MNVFVVRISFHFARNAARLHREESNCPHKFRNFVVKIKIIEIRVLDPCLVAEISQNAITLRVLISENDFLTTSNWHTELNKTNFFVT